MPPYSGILSRKSFNLSLAQLPSEPSVQLPGKVVIEFGEKLDIEEKDSGGGQFVSDNVEENLRTIVSRCLRRALLGADGKKPHSKNGSAIAEEDSLSTCKVGGLATGRQYGTGEA